MIREDMEEHHNHYNPFKFEPGGILGIFRERLQEPFKSAVLIQRANPIQDVENVLLEEETDGENIPLMQESHSQETQPHSQDPQSQSQELQAQKHQDTLSLFEEDSIITSTILHSIKPLVPFTDKDNKLSCRNHGSEFLELPNEDIFSEEMDELLSLKMSSPIYESDYDSDASDDLSAVAE
jgi:hypothetical protein